jgi:hypothetical protein
VEVPAGAGGDSGAEYKLAAMLKRSHTLSIPPQNIKFTVAMQQLTIQQALAEAFHTRRLVLTRFVVWR